MRAIRLLEYTLALAFFACGNETLELFPGSTDAAHTTEEAPVAVEDESESGAEYACELNSDCTNRDRPDCDPAAHVCVECIGLATDCAGQAMSRCNRIDNTCAFPCEKKADCANPSVCDSLGVCVECLTDSDCSPDQKRCVSEQCVQCTLRTDCAADMMCWHNACVACRTNADCPQGQSCIDNECS